MCDIEKIRVFAGILQLGSEVSAVTVWAIIHAVFLHVLFGESCGLFYVGITKGGFPETSALQAWDTFLWCSLHLLAAARFHKIDVALFAVLH